MELTESQMYNLNIPSRKASHALTEIYELKRVLILLYLEEREVSTPKHKRELTMIINRWIKEGH